ncbi:hypothetical protein ABE44_34745, partial [Bacillus thuringiensis]|uniref:hypothetical protein n=1 Tax=Bacillus thuringiensis TaxID=1428 RepID=UPI001A7E9CF3
EDFHVNSTVYLRLVRNGQEVFTKYLVDGSNSISIDENIEFDEVSWVFEFMSSSLNLKISSDLQGFIGEPTPRVDYDNCDNIADPNKEYEVGGNTLWFSPNHPAYATTEIRIRNKTPNAEFSATLNFFTNGVVHTSVDSNSATDVVTVPAQSIPLSFDRVDLVLHLHDLGDYIVDFGYICYS